MKLSEILFQFEQRIPLNLQENWDRCGLQVGSLNQDVSKILFSIDICHEVIQFAVKNKIDFIVTHHPLSMSDYKNINLDTYEGQMIKTAIKNNIAIYSSHTNHDRSLESLSRYYAKELHLNSVTPIEKANELYSKLIIFTPQSHTEILMEALFAAGAGKIGNYTKASYRHLGIGTFLPGEGANPFAGQKNKFEEVIEERLEVIFPSEIQKNILDTISKVHPYETPAFDIYQLQNEIDSELGVGAMGNLAKPISFGKILPKLKKLFKVSKARIVGNDHQLISKIAICNGSGAGYIPQVIKNEVDLFITGDMKYHYAIDAARQNLCIFDPGHFYSEVYSQTLLKDIFQDLFGKKLKYLEYSQLEDPLKIV